MATDRPERPPAGPVWEQARQERNWLLFRLEAGSRPGKLAKKPTLSGHDPVDRAAAARLTFDEARVVAKAQNMASSAAAGSPGHLVLGYFARSGAAMRVFNFDGCINENGAIAPDVAEIVSHGETFAEATVSGRGCVSGRPQRRRHRRDRN